MAQKSVNAEADRSGYHRGDNKSGRQPAATHSPKHWSIVSANVLPAARWPGEELTWPQVVRWASSRQEPLVVWLLAWLWALAWLCAPDCPLVVPDWSCVPAWLCVPDWVVPLVFWWALP